MAVAISVETRTDNIGTTLSSSAIGKIINLAELDEPINGSLWISSPNWPLMEARLAWRSELVENQSTILVAGDSTGNAIERSYDDTITRLKLRQAM